MTDPYERRQVRVMAILQMVLFVLASVFSVDWLLSENPSAITPFVVATGLSFLFLIYTINRRGHYRVAAWIFVTLTIVISYALVLDRPIDALALTYQVLAVATVGVFLSMRMTVIVGLIVCVATLGLPMVVPLQLTHDQLAPNQQIIVMLVMVIVLGTWHRESLHNLNRMQVERSETRYRIISELLSDFAIAFDAHYDDPPLEWVSDAVTKVTGYTAAELPRVSDWDSKIHSDDLLRLKAQRLRMFRGEDEQAEPIRFFHKDGHTVWLSIRLHPERKDGRVVTVYCAVSDITHQKQLEIEVSEKERLRELLEKEQEASQSNRKIVSLISHEFRTPLAVILSTSELLDNYIDRMPEARRHELTERIISHATQMAATVEDLSLLIQMQRGHLPFRPVPIDMAGLVQRLVADIQATIGEAHQFDIQLDGDLSAVLLDERLMTIVLNNLLSNAVKYSPVGTTITVRVQRLGDTVQLNIADQGIGIPEDDKAKLFRPYFRASNVGTVVGTGLGLQTVKECVEVHGGTITLDSTVDVGTTFTIALPAQQPQDETQPAMSTAEPSRV